MSVITKIETLALAGTKKGRITISNVTEPYGKDTEDVLSIGISLDEMDVQWKAHIPYDNLEELIAILQRVHNSKKTDF